MPSLATSELNLAKMNMTSNAGFNKIPRKLQSTSIIDPFVNRHRDFVVKKNAGETEEFKERVATSNSIHNDIVKVLTSKRD